MQQITVPSFAKVNLALDVLEKRPADGYHDVNMIMVPVSLADQIMLTLTLDGEVRVTSSAAIPGPADSNLAYRAAKLLKEVTGSPLGSTIHIDKVIPVAGGMAGGSTNAAAVLNGLNRLWRTGLGNRDLVDLAIRLGSDVPFFIPGGPARVEGIGERLSPVKVTAPLWVVLATPAVAKSTGNVYRLFDELERVVRPDVAGMEAALAAGDLAGIAGKLGNVFEQVMLPRHPEIAALKEQMLAGGALGALMSGAGPTVFGLVPDKEAGLALLGRLKPTGARTWLVQTVGH